MPLAEVGFQSLFSWKSPSDIKDALSKQLISLFQSLFSWKSPSDMLVAAHLKIDLTVSILVFVEVALGLYEKDCRGRYWLEFQSLFSWKSPSDKALVSYSHTIFCVSILVFVEVALGQEGWEGSGPHDGVSILVFVEVALGQAMFEPIELLGVLVSILVFVEVALGRRA